VEWKQVVTSQNASPSPPVGYESLRRSVAWADLGRRTTILARGRDAVRFVDNFTTAALSGLEPGQGSEAFFTDAKGWVLALATILRIEDGLLIDADGGLPVSLAEHLSHYLIREQVEIVDASADTACLLVAGPDAENWLAPRIARSGDGEALSERPRLPDGLSDHAALIVDGVPAVLVRVDWAGPVGFLVRLAASDRPLLIAAWRAAAAAEAEPLAVETARIEAGRPMPADIPEKTLPQELGRDARAISFTKGCYLGQETVARIDALGHVNRRLTAVTAEKAFAPASRVMVGGEPIGVIGSSCWSPRLRAHLGLGLLQARRLADPGPKKGGLAIEGLPADVVALPLAESIGDSTIASSNEGEIVFETRRFRVRRVPEARPAGATATEPPRLRDVIEHPGSVVVVPMVSATEVCLIEVVRVAVGRPLLELPAGTLDRVESLAEAAARELTEETGYRAGRIDQIASFWMSPGILRERMHLFLATDLASGPQALEPGEVITTRLVGWDEAIAMCLDGRIDDAKTVAGLLLCDARRRNRQTAT